MSNPFGRESMSWVTIQPSTQRVRVARFCGFSLLSDLDFMIPWINPADIQLYFPSLMFGIPVMNYVNTSDFPQCTVSLSLFSSEVRCLSEASWPRRITFWVWKWSPSALSLALLFCFSTCAIRRLNLLASGRWILLLLPVTPLSLKEEDMVQTVRRSSPSGPSWPTEPLRQCPKPLHFLGQSIPKIP